MRKTLLLVFAAVAATAHGADAYNWSGLQDALNQGGTVRLAADCFAPADGTVTLSVTNGAVTLDLSGHNITGNGYDTVMEVRDGGSLTLTNSAAAAGAITGGGYHGVYVGGRGVFTMNGGSITGNACAEGCGGGVFVDGNGVFTMNGGVVSGNAADKDGGGVYVDGDGTFTMNGGVISENTADGCAGGVYAEGSIAVNGGMVFGNAADWCGGVYLEGTLSVSGKPVVSGNADYYGNRFNIFGYGAFIAVVGSLSAGASIGVTTSATPGETSPVVFTGAISGDVESARRCFFSDKSDFHVETANGALCLAVGEEPVAYPAYLDGADESVKAKYNAWAARYGADAAGAFEGQFLLGLSPAVQLPAGGSLLKVVGFSLTETGHRLDLASDAGPFFQPAGREGDVFLGNGILAMKTGASLSTMLGAGASAMAVPATIDVVTGHATVDLGFDVCPASADASFFRPLITASSPYAAGLRPEGGYAPAGYRLVWSDEFDSGDKPSAEWDYNVGGGGWGNGEQQYYCDGGEFRRGNYQRQTAYVGDGTLKIKAYKLPSSVQPRPDGCGYISARMNTTNGWKYGYVEMRAKLPPVKGCWPAFWMLPQDRLHYDVENDAKAGEIDMMEYVPGDPDPQAINKIYFSAHSQNATRLSPTGGTTYEDPVTHEGHPYCQDGIVANPAEWHCYGMEWTHEGIRGYLDGVQFFYAPNPIPDEEDMGNPETWPFNQEYYIKLNLAVGSDLSWGGKPDDDFTEATFEVDWVRVYQK